MKKTSIDVFLKKNTKPFKIMFSDLSEVKQKEYLELSKLKPNEISNEIPLTTLYIDPEDFVTIATFWEAVRNL
jgi:hypothetical protein